VPCGYKSVDGARLVVEFNKSRVQTKYLNLIQDAELKLFQDKKGKYFWEQNKDLEERKKEILKMLDQEVAYKEIIDKVGYSKSNITKVKKKAIEEGWLTEDGKLTKTGSIYINS
jgi:DNA-directed RNA polymerase specialized sigma subunit